MLATRPALLLRYPDPRRVRFTGKFGDSSPTFFIVRSVLCRPLLRHRCGALGAFVAGSNTVSDMMFALFQYGVAHDTAASHVIILGLQAFGGAAGNMITVHNVVAASATVGLAGVEGVLIRKTILPMSYYLLVGGLIGILLVYVLCVNVF